LRATAGGAAITASALDLAGYAARLQGGAKRVGAGHIGGDGLETVNGSDVGTAFDDAVPDALQRLVRGEAGPAGLGVGRALVGADLDADAFLCGRSVGSGGDRRGGRGAIAQPAV